MKTHQKIKGIMIVWLIGLMIMGAAGLMDTTAIDTAGDEDLDPSPFVITV